MRVSKVPLFLAMFVLDFVQFGLAFFYISLIYCISSNQVKNGYNCDDIIREWGEKAIGCTLKCRYFALYLIHILQQDANDDHYCPIPITFFLFVMMW